VNSGKSQYTGLGINTFDGGHVIKGETDIGYWIYRFEPLYDTGAELDSEGLPLRVGEYIVFGYYNNGRYMDYRESIFMITPAPLTIDVLLESDSKVYDGSTTIGLDSAEPIGIIGDDEVIISMYGIPTFKSPDVGYDIEVIFTDFKIGGTHAWNYFVVQPDSLVANITRSVYKGSISVVINDELLRIGSELTFTATSDPSDYLIQWRVDGEDINGANDLTYVVRPADADKKISVVLVSPCRNYEGESLPTDYVPYTINLAPGSTIPMGTDDVFFGESGIVTAYAASKNDGFVDISYVLYDSGLDSDYLKFSLSGISNVSSVGSGISQYNVIPSDAVNGIVTIIATFYHRGVRITPVGGHAFDDLDCGYSFNDYFTLTITQMGNAPTGPITVNLSGADNDAFSLSAYSLPSININESVTIDVGVNAGNTPVSFYDKTYTASINVSGDNLNIHSVPVAVKISHSYSQLTYRNGFHDQSCVGCNLYKSGLCSYSNWSVSAGAHRRSCSVCLGADSHTPVWTMWNLGNSTSHLRTCTLCDITDSGSHNDLSFPSTWTNHDATNHSRARSCNVCNRLMRTELQAHTWGNWGAWTQGDANNHHRTGSCTAAGCARAAVVGTTAGTFAAHTWGAWTNHDATNHRRTCSTAGCARSQDQAHTWGNWSGWANHNATQHRRTRTCTTAGCARAGEELQNHTWGAWVNQDATNHRRTCSTAGCVRAEDQAHTWGTWSGWANHNATQHRRTRTCTTAGCARTGEELQNHTWGAWARYDSNYHRRTCTATGCDRYEAELHNWVLTVGRSDYAGIGLMGVVNRRYHHTDYHVCSGCNHQTIWGQGALCFMQNQSGTWVCTGSSYSSNGLIYRNNDWGCGITSSTLPHEHNRVRTG
jgi:hypothetical protein